MAVAYLADAAVDCLPASGAVPPQAIAVVRQMLAQRFNTPLTSSVGRLFDGVAALAGVRQHVDYEGQAAMELEWLAAEVAPDGTYPFDLAQAASGTHVPWQIDVRPLIAATAEDVRRGISAGLIARRFHSTLVEIISQTCGRLRDQTGLDVVALSGGVFMNGLLLGETVLRLTGEGFRVFRHQRVPPNDAGLSLGQLTIAAALQACENATASSLLRR